MIGVGDVGEEDEEAVGVWDEEISEVKEIRGELFRVSRFSVDDSVCHHLPR